MEETQIPKSCRADNAERKEKAYPLNELKLKVWWVSLNEYIKKRLDHKERDNY